MIRINQMTNIQLHKLLDNWVPAYMDMKTPSIKREVASQITEVAEVLERRNAIEDDKLNAIRQIVRVL